MRKVLSEPLRGVTGRKRDQESQKEERRSGGHVQAGTGKKAHSLYTKAYRATLIKSLVLHGRDGRHKSQLRVAFPGVKAAQELRS